ncbi:MAG: DUF5069 domain-containing protein [Candidatus Eremiobacteraeota bacterium]|nr:DUF5069 domain-containing protein [Candidatus Eremiobacteraeota bacterium]
MTATAAPVIPRRWNTEVEGIKWLPRLCDKARMSRAGTLGAYLVGHSPVDRGLLSRLGVSTDEFIAVALAAPDDAAALAAFRTRGFDEARVRRWSDRFETTYRFYIPLWDLDEGYRTPNALERAMIPFGRAFEGPLMAIARRILPRP